MCALSETCTKLCRCRPFMRSTCNSHFSSLGMESEDARVLVLSAMFPTLSEAAIHLVARQSASTAIAAAHCTALLHPKLTLASIRNAAKDPTGALADIKTAATETIELFGAEVYDVPSVDEYHSTVVTVDCDTSSWDRVAFSTPQTIPSTCGALPTVEERDIAWVEQTSSRAASLLKARMWEDWETQCGYDVRKSVCGCV